MISVLFPSKFPVLTLNARLVIYFLEGFHSSTSVPSTWRIGRRDRQQTKVCEVNLVQFRWLCSKQVVLNFCRTRLIVERSNRRHFKVPKRPCEYRCSRTSHSLDENSTHYRTCASSHKLSMSQPCRLGAQLTQFYIIRSSLAYLPVLNIDWALNVMGTLEQQLFWRLPHP